MPSLDATAEHCDLVGVVTQPDRPGHRGRTAPRPVADRARALGVALLQPARIRDAAATAAVVALGADVLVVAAYGQILPGSLLAAHRLGGVNVHASLLPRWRGAAPIAAAILHGDAQTGVSIMRMEPTLDTGPVYAAVPIAIGSRATQRDLSATLAQLGATALGTVLDRLAEGSVIPVPQDSARVTVAPQLTRADGDVAWDVHDAITVDRMVRAFDPWPGVRASLGGDMVAILAGEPLAGGGEPGAILGGSGEAVDVATRDGIFRITEVHPANSRPMTAGAYLRGRRS